MEAVRGSPKFRASQATNNYIQLVNIAVSCYKNKDLNNLVLPRSCVSEKNKNNTIV